MTIEAKYPGTCAHCHGPVRVGERIEWAKGQPVRHAGCAGTGRTHRVAHGTGAGAPAARPAYATRGSGPRTIGRCAECGAPAVTRAPDSSGIVAPVCGRCARLPRAERSYH